MPLVGLLARVDQGQLHVLQSGGAGQQIEGLEDEADLLVADLGQVIIGHGGRQLAVQFIGAMGRRVQAADDVHHGGFAGSRRTHDGHVLPSSDLHGDAIQGPDFHIAHLIELGDVGESDQRRLGHGFLNGPRGVVSSSQMWRPRFREAG